MTPHKLPGMKRFYLNILPYFRLPLWIVVTGWLCIIFFNVVVVDAQIKKGGAGSMTTIESLQAQLKSFILRDQVFEAEKILKQIGKNAAPVLLELAKSKKAQVRRNVLELAGELGDVESCRLVLSSLDDPDEEVRSLATFQVNKCSHRELIPEMLVALEKHPDSITRGNLSMQLGMIGNNEHIPILNKYRRISKDPELSHQISLALVRLGDPIARSELIKRLQAPDSIVRFRALQDCLYVQDKSLATYFSTALEDLREVVQLTIPEEKPTVYGRVCDVAVTVMEGLGFKFSFSAETVWVRSAKELEEAKAIVSNIPKK